MSVTRRSARLAGILASAILASTGGVARAQDTDTCIAASEKAVALQKTGKLVQARAALATCAASSCPDPVSSSCRQRLGEVGKVIPSVVFFAKEGGGHDLVAVKLSIDGASYADHLDGNAIVLDPGEHEFRFEVAGQAPVVRRLVLHQGEKNRREDIVIGAAPTPVPAATPASTPAPAPDPQPAAHWSAQRTTGLVIGGIGVAGLIAGGIFGGLSLSAHSSYENSCGSNIGAPAGHCNGAGVSGESDAASKGTASTILFIGGGVAMAAGAVLYFTAPRGATTPQVGVTPGGFVVNGRF